MAASGDMARDDKSFVFEYMFDSRWDESTQTLSDPVFTLEDVSKAIAACNKKDGKDRSTRNPANFVKDYPRHRTAANQKWPERLKEIGYTIKQLTGTGQCFEFVRMRPGQLPFPLIGDWENAEHFRIQSLSMPLASRSLGRSDEAWLTQVAVKLHFIEAYFALSSTKRKLIEIDHLQMNAKLRKSEIDSIYRYSEDMDGKAVHGLILLEAKGRSEDVSYDQLINSLEAGATLVPHGTPLMSMAIKIVGDSTVHVMEFEVVEGSDVGGRTELELRHEAVIEVCPRVPGV